MLFLIAVSIYPRQRFIAAFTGIQIQTLPFVCTDCNEFQEFREQLDQFKQVVKRIKNGMFSILSILNKS